MNGLFSAKRRERDTTRPSCPRAFFVYDTIVRNKPIRKVSVREKGNLYRPCGDKDSLGNAHGDRIMEIQRFSVAEPSTMALMGCGLGGLLMCAWRKWRVTA